MFSSFHSLTRFVRILAKNILLQIISFAVIMSLIGITYAVYTSIDSNDIQSGDTVTTTLMSTIKTNLDDLNTRVGLISIPAGAIMAFNLGACPSGWIAANGSSGTPDLRGEFVRGLDSGRGIDPARTLASWQNFEIQSHDHTVGGGTAAFLAVSIGGQPGARLSGIPTTGMTGGSETRPRNVALLYCMKQ